jgi:DNA-binding response OmpR family regulator
MKALIVDDDATSRYLLRLALIREFAWTPIEATDGEEALRLLETESMGVIFLDLNMPKLGGIQTLLALRESPVHRDVPVVVLTAEHQESTVRDALALGVTDYLVKPLSIEQLSRRIGRTLSRSRAR